MNALHEWAPLFDALALAIPLALAGAAFARPRRADVACALSLCLALLVTVGTAALRGASPAALPFVAVRVDVITCVMLLLVSGVGLVIARYSRAYLHGDPEIATYFRWLLVTLSAVTFLIVADDLLVLAAAWTATSLSLHRLLTHYPERTQALVAAHKKFLVSRLADLCLWSAIALVHLNVGSLKLDRIAEWAAANPSLTPSMHLAALLVVNAVALRTAQLPFHGWLMQVMEAPTPVSALLHAGVVNIGGFVLIRLAPWLAQAWPAQLLLVLVGLGSACVAALVMTTRVSAKGALAWSTCAQMGFMLVQCGLGAWHLALLHLVAHSLYKAHAFLSAGSAVEAWRLGAAREAAPSPSAWSLGLASLLSLGAAIGCVWLLERLGALGGQADASVWVIAVLVALSVTPMLARQTRSGVAARAAMAVSAGAVALLYLGWHASAARIVPSLGATSASSSVLWVVVGAAFVALFWLKSTLELRPAAPLARALYPWLFAGLYLDDRFTRLTFRVWPPRLGQADATRPMPIRDTVEA